MDEIESQLKTIKFHLLTYTKPKTTKKCKKQILHFGNIHQPFHGYRECVANKEYPELYEDLKSFMHNLDPEFEYSTITINKNILCIPHFDKANTSKCWIVGLGDYEGGELVIENKEFDIKKKPMKFDGAKKLHWNKEWTGDRYSCMFFRNKKSELISQK